MSARALAFVLLLSSACAAPRSSSDPQAPLGGPRVATACEQECKGRAQARAVPPIIIEADCKKRCDAVMAWPLVDAGPSARQQIGGDVRAFGVIEGRQLRLADGIRVRLDTPDDPDGLLLPGPAWVLGRLETEPEGFLLTVRQVTAAPSVSGPGSSD